MKEKQLRTCFINDTNCSEKYAEAHILSRSATMSLLKGPTKAGLKVVHMGNLDQSNQILPMEIGWKKASAHYCFCKKHDNNVFEKIENGNSFNPSSLEQKFLHSLRSFAFSYYRKKSEPSINITLADDFMEIRASLLQTLSLKPNDEFKKNIDARRNLYMAEFDAIRNELLDILNKKQYNRLEYKSWIFNQKNPFASAGTLIAEIIDKTHEQISIFHHNSNDIIFKNPGIILTVLPLKENKTVVILSALKKDNNALLYLNKFEMLNKIDLQRAITSLMLSSNKENTFLNPILWDFLKTEGNVEQIILSELNSGRGLDLLSKPLKLSGVNLFSSRCTSNSLKIE